MHHCWRRHLSKSAVGHSSAENNDCYGRCQQMHTLQMRRQRPSHSLPLRGPGLSSSATFSNSVLSKPAQHVFDRLSEPLEPTREANRVTYMNRAAQMAVRERNRSAPAGGSSSSYSSGDTANGGPPCTLRRSYGNAARSQAEPPGSRAAVDAGRDRQPQWSGWDWAAGGRTSLVGSTGNMSVTSSPPGLISFAQVAAHCSLTGGWRAHMNLRCQLMD